jgi:WD40 repeat protein
MDVATYRRGNEMRVLYSTSLGQVSVVSVDEITQTWRHISSLHHHTGPVLTVSVVETHHGTWAVTGGTNGIVAIWNLDDSETISPAHVLESAHQSGVNALTICQGVSSEDTLLVVSAGDDQVLRAQELLIDASRVTPVRVNAFNFSHSSAVRSVWTDGARVISTSVDQRVKLWDIREDVFAIVPRGGVVTQAPEPEAIDVFQAPNGTMTLAVAGRGFELFQII